MSWFKRRPRIKEPAKLVPHHTSPLAEKIRKEAKEATNPTPKKKTAKPK
jgi:hypothetical protein